MEKVTESARFPCSDFTWHADGLEKAVNRRYFHSLTCLYLVYADVQKLVGQLRQSEDG